MVNVKRNSKDALNPGIKTGNYLNNVLAKIEADHFGAHDALMLNPFGQLTESTTSNFFFVQDGRVMTPSLDCGILAGITRDIVIRIARENDIPFEAVESELAEKIEPVMDEHGAAEHMYTRTLGELYFSQGVLVRALKVFQYLQEQDPIDLEISRRVKELEDDILTELELKEEVHEALDVVPVQACGGFVEDVYGAALGTFGEFE